MKIITQMLDVALGVGAMLTLLILFAILNGILNR